jgi:hypothetical protein
MCVAGRPPPTMSSARPRPSTCRVGALDGAEAALESGYTITEAAEPVGYGSCETLRRAFVTRLGVSPSAYQQRFRSAQRRDAGPGLERRGRGEPPLPLGRREPDEWHDRRHRVVSPAGDGLRERVADPVPDACHPQRQPPTQLPSHVCPRGRLASRHSCWPVSGLGRRGEPSAT